MRVGVTTTLVQGGSFMRIIAACIAVGAIISSPMHASACPAPGNVSSGSQTGAVVTLSAGETYNGDPIDTSCGQQIAIQIVAQGDASWALKDPASGKVLESGAVHDGVDQRLPLTSPYASVTLTLKGLSPAGGTVVASVVVPPTAS
jgi:hypothetical protein